MTSPRPVPTVVNKPAQSEARPAGMVTLVFIDGTTSNAQVCILPPDGAPDGDLHQASIALDGSLSSKVIRRTLRELGWHDQRGDSIFVVVPSEEVFLHIEEFPTGDENEAITMAEGLFNSLVDLDPSENIPAVQVLHGGASRTVCALVVFQRDRLQRLFGLLEKLGVLSARFVLDAVGVWQVSSDVVREGFWGWVAQNDAGSRTVVKVIKVHDGVIRAVRQRFFHQGMMDEPSRQALGPALFPEEFGGEEAPGISWHLSQQSSELSSHAAEIGRLAASGELLDFKLEPDFWKAQLRQRHFRQRLVGGLFLAATTYLAFLIFLGVLSLVQWREEKNLRRVLQSQESAFKGAMDVKRQLAVVRASRDSSSSVLEVLRQIAEYMPDSITLENFSFRFQDSIKLRGVSTQSEPVYDLVGKLRTIPAFRNAKVDSVGSNQSGGGVTWQIIIPLQLRKMEKGGLVPP